MSGYRSESGQRRVRALAFACLLLASCVETPPPTVSLRVKGSIPDASVTIDDEYIGAFAFVAKHGVALPPGKHRITVEKVGYFPWDRLVEAREGDPPIHLDIALIKVPD